MPDATDSELGEVESIVVRKRRKGIYILPNLVTLAALFGGFYAVVMAMNGRFDLAAVGIFFVGITLGRYVSVNALLDRLAIAGTLVVAGSVAAVGLTVNDSKLPPLARVIVREAVLASTYTSSVGAAIDSVPVVAPAAMLIVWPVDKVTLTGVCAALESVAV